MSTALAAAYRIAPRDPDAGTPEELSLCGTLLIQAALAAARHGDDRATARDGWRWLPAEHRAAHLLDDARAYLHVDDPANAGRALIDADHTAPAEVRHRPAARTVLAQVARDPHAPATIIQLATTLGVT
ncbi:hypothetical protein ACH4T9_29730 [Micromonospora sp. NPDC020750]|uniref:hypothetical protein n=1 Tax=unclassified Micromonospora TaxID=2617518 RepID=UPI0037BD1897